MSEERNKENEKQIGECLDAVRKFFNFVLEKNESLRVRKKMRRASNTLLKAITAADLVPEGTFSACDEVQIMPGKIETPGNGED